MENESASALGPLSKLAECEDYRRPAVGAPARHCRVYTRRVFPEFCSVGCRIAIFVMGPTRGWNRHRGLDRPRAKTIPANFGGRLETVIMATWQSNFCEPTRRRWSFWQRYVAAANKLCASSTSTCTPAARPSSATSAPHWARWGEGAGLKTASNPMERRNKRPEPLPLRQAPQCGAKTRRGSACKAKAANGKGRCRLHGGALGSGAPSGHRNGNYRHGQHTKEAIAERQFMRALLRQSRELLQRVEAARLPHQGPGT